MCLFWMLFHGFLIYFVRVLLEQLTMKGTGNISIFDAFIGLIETETGLYPKRGILRVHVSAKS